MTRIPAAAGLAVLTLALAACGQKPSGQAPQSAPAAAPPPITSEVIPLQIKTAAGQPVSGNPANGQQDFVVCSACHSIQAGQNMVGPSLHGVVNRRAGTIPGFHYSSANKSSGLVWTEQELYAYLESPQTVVPGTYMTYVGMKDAQQRADVIAYLQQAGR
jgi:cytochrome c